MRNFDLVYSFIEMVKELFNDPEVTSFLSERIQQDPLEKHFGKQRQRGGTNENPTVAQYHKNDQALKVISTINLDITSGNTRGTNKRKLTTELDEYKPLNRRSKRRKLDNRSTNNI